MKQIVPNLFSNQIRRSLFLFLSMFAFSFAMIAQNPTNGGNIAGNQTLCAGTVPGILTSQSPAAGGGTGTIEYLWMSTTQAGAQPGGAGYTSITNSNSASYQPGPLYATTYFVRCARRVGSGNLEFSAESNNIVTVTVNDLPNSSIGGNPGGGFVGTTIDFTASNAGPGATYTWNFGNGTSCTSSSPTGCSGTYNGAGSYTVTLTVTTSNGCSATTTGNLTILNPYEANITDPCDCTNGANYYPPGSLNYYNNDYILINSNPGETWTISSISNFSGAGGDIYIVNSLTGTITPITVGTQIPASNTTGGYFLNLWFNGNAGGWSVTVQNQNGFQLSTGAGAINPCPPCPGTLLPVELSEFKATVVNGKQVELAWVTSAEIDNSHFEIERSLDGVRFDFIGQKEGVGTTSSNSYYKLIDTEAVPGETYYRLKQVDLDGEYTYSDVVSVRIESDQVIVNVSPNPVADKTVVRLGTAVAPNTVLELISTTGQIVRTYKVADNSSSLEIDMSGLAEGVYLLSVANASREQKAFYKVVKF